MIRNEDIIIDMEQVQDTDFGLDEGIDAAAKKET